MLAPAPGVGTIPVRRRHPSPCALDGTSVIHDYSCSLPNDIAAVPQLRDRFEAALVDAGLSAMEIDVWKLLFTELVSNAIEHGCGRNGDRVTLGYAIEVETVVVHTIDPGNHKKLSQDDVHNADASGFTETGRGAGLYLIREFSDEFVVEHVAGGGTRMRVMKRRGSVGGLA